MGREGCSEPHWGLRQGSQGTTLLQLGVCPSSSILALGEPGLCSPSTLEVTHSELRHQMGADRAAWGFHCICVCAHEAVCPCA